MPVFFFFNDTATTEIYTLSLHDALPISRREDQHTFVPVHQVDLLPGQAGVLQPDRHRSEEHTSELQSHLNLVCRLLLEKKKNNSHHRDSARDVIPILSMIVADSG